MHEIHADVAEEAPAAPEARTAPRKRFPIRPAHPERVCWGCDRYCPTTDMLCGNGTVATPHPSELFGDDWMAWGGEPNDRP